MRPTLASSPTAIRALCCAGLLLCAATTLAGAPAPVDWRPELLVQIEVADLDRAIEFYTVRLGFEVTERRDDLKFAHLTSNVPGLELGLSEVESPQVAGPILNFTVADVEAARRTLEAAGVPFRGETVLIPGKVRLAAFADPDGNRLRLAGPPGDAAP